MYLSWDSTLLDAEEDSAQRLQQKMIYFENIFQSGPRIYRTI